MGRVLEVSEKGLERGCAVAVLGGGVPCRRDGWEEGLRGMETGKSPSGSDLEGVRSGALAGKLTR